jgi:hypothetical protein
VYLARECQEVESGLVEELQMGKEPLHEELMIVAGGEEP